jgi:hypothetical protein
MPMSIASPHKKHSRIDPAAGSPGTASRGGAFVGPSLVALLLLAVACTPEMEPPPAVDEPQYDGLTREQIEQQAEPMTPAEAERLGIVDTTIRIEPPMNPDSVLPGDFVEP